VFVGDPGERKTTADDIAFERIKQHMEEALIQYDIVLSAWESARGNKESGEEAGPRPREPVWYVMDSTSEGLIHYLGNHWPTLTLTNSDAAAWVGGYSMREGRDTATAATLSSLWSGTTHSQVRASMKRAMVLFNRRLSLSLMIQPEVAGNLIESKTLTGQGFLSRCLPAFPQSKMGTRLYRRYTQDPRLEIFYEAQSRFLCQQPIMNLSTGTLQPKSMAVNEHALEAWIPHYNTFENGLLDEYSSIKEIANKAPEQILRLAGIRAALEGADCVTTNHIEDAAQLTRWYMHEWINITGKLNAHRKEVALPRQLVEWMRKKRQETGQSVFNVRRIYQSGPRLFRGKSQLANESMLELLKRGYVRPQGREYELRPEEDL
jgi:hypothetical protein